MSEEKSVLSWRMMRVVLAKTPRGERHIVRHPGAVIIIPKLPNGNFLLVDQGRFSIGKRLLEFPAGTLEIDEAPLSCAAREVREEVGMRAGKIRHVTSWYPAPGFCDEIQHVFFAEELVPDPLPQDEDEDIQVIEFSLEQLLSKLKAGELQDAKTIACIALLQSGIL